MTGYPKPRHNSDRVSEMFHRRAVDWTPTSASHSASLLFASVSVDPVVSECCASVLSAAELQRAGRFVTEIERANFLQRRAFQRYCASVATGVRLSQIVFEKTAKGRPYLPDYPNISLSFSACRLGLLGAWSSTHAVGVDIEDKERDLEPVELARYFFSLAEAMAVETAGGLESKQVFLRLWCLKEAALKSIGEGLPMGLDSFEFELDPDIRIVRIAGTERGETGRFEAYKIENNQVCAAFVVNDREREGLENAIYP